MRRLLRWLAWSLGGLVLLSLVAAGGGYLWLRQSLPQIEGTIEVAGLGAPVDDRARPLGDPPHRGGASPRCELRARVRPCPGPALADGVPAAAGRRTSGGDPRRGGAAERSLHAHAGSVPPGGSEPRAPGPGHGCVARGLCRRRQRLPRAPHRPAAAGVPDPPPQQGGAVAPDRQPGLAAGDGARSRHQLPRRAGARPPRQAPVEGADRGPLAEPIRTARRSLWPSWRALCRGISSLRCCRPRHQAASARMPGWSTPRVRPRAGRCSRTIRIFTCRLPACGISRTSRRPSSRWSGRPCPAFRRSCSGTTAAIAWGFTNTGADTQDLFIERVDPEDPTRYLTPDGSAPFAVREEVIEVAGGAPVALSVRATRHGPVISDLLPDAAATFGADHVVALAWSAPAEDDLAIQALLGIDRARDWSGFVAALRDVGAPMQNIFYADGSGHIGFIAPGRVPIRKHGDGRWPVPGWTGEYDWTGWVPFDALPRALDPPGGVLFNANNRIVPPDYPYLLTADWEAPYRARRLAELLQRAAIRAGGVRGDAGGSAVAARAGSAAGHAGGASRAVPRRPPRWPGSRRWDRVMRADAAEPLIFAAWYRELSRLIYADELGDLFDAFWHVRPQFMELVLTQPPDLVRRHPHRPDRDVRRARGGRAGRGAARPGPPVRRRSGGLAVGRCPCRADERIRCSRTSRCSAGCSTSRRRAAATASRSTSGTSIRATSGGRSPAPMRATYRAIYDLAHLDASRFVTRHRPVGQSAVTPLSRFDETMGDRRVGADRT